MQTNVQMVNILLRLKSMKVEGAITTDGWPHFRAILHRKDSFEMVRRLA